MPRWLIVRKIGRKSSWILFALSGDDAYRNLGGINRCNLWSVKYWCSCSVSRRLAKGSHELQSTEKPSQLTKNWISDFKITSVIKDFFDEVFHMISPRNALRSTAAELKTNGFMSDTWKSVSLPVVRSRSL